MIYGHTVVDDEGAIYIHNIPWHPEETIAEAIEKMIDKYDHIVINLANLIHFDKNGVEIINHAINLIRKNEKSVSIRCRQWVKEKLSNDLFVTFDTLDEDLRELLAV